MQRVSVSQGLGVFGKLPARGDFVHSGAVSPALEAWLTESVERSQGEVPDAPVRFLFSHQGNTLLGCWVKSRDEVGRTFPLCSFWTASPELTMLRWSSLPGLFDDYLAQLEQALAAQLAGTAESALAAVSAVVPPHESELVRTIFEMQARLADESSMAFGQRVFGPEMQLPMAYALWTLREACRRAAPNTTLDMPLVGPDAAFVWLELLACVAAGAKQAQPSFVWSPSLVRGLASFGLPTTSACAFLRDPGHGSSARWPLSTSRVDSQHALSQLSAAVQSALTEPTSLAVLVERLRSAP